MLRTARITSAIRRLKLEELLTKLQQIEQQAALTLEEYPRGLALERQRLIVALAKQMQTHLRDQFRNGERGPAQNDPGTAQNDPEAEDLHAVTADERVAG